MGVKVRRYGRRDPRDQQRLDAAHR